MRSTLFFISSVLFAAACGGGGGSKTPDAKIFLDSGVDAASACSVKCELKPPVVTSDLCDGDNFKGNIGFGNDTTPAEGDWFFQFGMDAGPLANRTAFSIALLVSESETLGDVMFIRALKPLQGGFPVNTPITFDPSPTSATPAAFSFIFGDVMINGGAIDTNTITQEFWATSGSLQFASISEVDAGITKGATSPFTWEEIDENGAVVSNGCKVAIGQNAGATAGFGFTLKQKAAPFQPTNNGAPQRINGMRVLSAAETQALENYIAKKYPNLMQ